MVVDLDQAQVGLLDTGLDLRHQLEAEGVVPPPHLSRALQWERVMHDTRRVQECHQLSGATARQQLGPGVAGRAAGRRVGVLPRRRRQ